MASEQTEVDPPRQTRIQTAFFRRYLTLCKAKNVQPLGELIGTCGDGAAAAMCRKRPRDGTRKLYPSIEFYGDRFKEADWQLVIGALAEDTTLQMVAIRLRKVFDGLLENSDFRPDVPLIEQPVILTKRLFSRLIDSLTQFLILNQKVRILTLEALPIQGPHMSSLVEGLQQNLSITELSLARSTIKDDGCKAVCRAIMNLPKIVTLNLSACHLSTAGCCAVAELVRFQKIQRFAESWECSLRYREIDTGKMQGLRHILLNGNPAIGDGGLCELTEQLKDDEWIRQIQFRNCGLTDEGAKFLVDCLNINKTIKEFDIRGNAGISVQMCNEILTKLGVDVDSSDSSLSLTNRRPKGPPRMKPSEQIRCLQQQLSAEQYRCAQLQVLVEQLRSHQNEYMVQMNKLKQDFNRISNEREDLQRRVQRLESNRPATRKLKLRKSKSESNPALLFTRNDPTHATNSAIKSEMTLRWLQDRHTARPGSARTVRRSHVLERTIGDGVPNVPALQDIAEVDEEVVVMQKNYIEGGFGDVGMEQVKPVIKVGPVGGDIGDGIDVVDFFNDIGDAADQWQHEDDEMSTDDEEDEFESLSDAQSCVQSLFRNVYKDEE
ncbi:conserved hypothetical protein [Culex quinquefasciatus]|uniref:Uncharacterized protein n=1 Tax=Culex quinquefasciatus TaxID=7176 RepID=B0XF43_CULQU|nr:conserved hypothetical protein [Culex quinquefasciatus]|eukprot:XP_001868265.1 conserved hypothetical protein [Culex quinquefasciatus]